MDTSPEKGRMTPRSEPQGQKAKPRATEHCVLEILISWDQPVTPFFPFIFFFSEQGIS